MKDMNRLTRTLLALICLLTLPLAANELPNVADVQLDASGIHTSNPWSPMASSS